MQCQDRVEKKRQDNDQPTSLFLPCQSSNGVEDSLRVPAAPGETIKIPNAHLMSV